jgi:hypothetical protein
MALLSTFVTKTSNYYDPLIPFAQYKEIKMARGKAKSNGIMRARMMNLRSGESTDAATTTTTTTTTRPAIYGRGGGRAWASGRGRQIVHLSNLVTKQRKQGDRNAAATMTTATGTTETTTTKKLTIDNMDDDRGTPTFSEMEPTNSK